MAETSKKEFKKEVKEVKEVKKVEPKKVNVEVIVNYLDVKQNVTKHVGDTFEVDFKRANELAKKGIVKII